MTGTGVTFCSDGWDSVADEQKINFLYFSPSASVFMCNEDITEVESKDAAFTSEIMLKQIRKRDEQHVVLVVTDTCSTMKAAWGDIEKALPHVTCDGCGPHVLSLLMKDLCKLAGVTDIIADVEYMSK